MVTSSLTGLVNNAALLMTLALICDIVVIRQPGQKPVLSQVPLGLLIGGIGMGIMMNPWEFLPGVIFDTRSVLLCVSGFLFGTVPALIACAITAGFRLFLGGAGAWTGVAVILTSGLAGLAWRHWVIKDQRDVSHKDLYLMGLITHGLMLLWMITLPRSIAWDVLLKISLPIIMVFPLATVLLGKLILNRHGRIHLTKALEAGEAKYRSLVEGIPGMVCGFLPDGTITFVSKSYCEYFDKTYDELIGKAFLFLIPESEQKTVMDNIWALNAETPQQSHEHRVIGPDGNISWQRWTNRALFDPDGKIRGYQSIGEDVTLRKTTESALKKSEERLRRVVESMPVMMNAFDGNANIIAWNRESERVTGYKAHEIVGNPNALEILYPDTAHREQMIDELADPGSDFRNKDYTVICKDGTMKTISWSNISGRSPIPGWHTWAVGMDVTRHRKDESDLKTALEKANLRQREITALLEASQSIPRSRTFETAARTIFDICTDLIGSTSGYVALLSRDGMENQVLFLEAGGLPCDVDPELPMPIRGLREVAYRTCEVVYDNDFFNSQWMKYMPKGHVVLENVLFAPLVIQNRAVGLMGMANKPGGFTPMDAEIAKAFGDLAAVGLTYVKYQEDLRDSEEKHRSIMEAMEDAIAIYSPDYRVEFMNPAMIRRAGRNGIGLICHKAVHGLDDRCPWCNHGKIMAGGYTSTEIESPLDHKIYHISSSPISHADGTVSHLSVFRDITAVKKMENRLQHAQKMEAIGSLAGGIAHDFNNILFPIVGLSEMLMEDVEDDSPEKKSLAEIFKAAQRGSDLVKQILAFSRQTEHRILPVSIQSVIKEVFKLCRSTIPSDIKLSKDIQHNCGPVNADPTQIHQVAMNLITNAFHAVEGNSGQIHIKLCEKQTAPDGDNDFIPPGRWACLTVSDTGCGIEPDVMDRIFDPYFTTKAKGKGTGLGLATVYGIVKEHGGEIKVYSEPGKGTVFNTYFPLIEQAADPPSAGKKERKARTGTGRILLADDETAIVQIEKQMLERLGYEVTSFTNSVEALASFKSDPRAYDLVITDMTMPQMTGDLLAKGIRAVRPGIPIIICTGFSERLSREKAKDLGINGYLMKPVVRSDMADLVHKVLNPPGR